MRCFRALGYRFGIQTSDHGLEQFLHEVLAPLSGDDEPTAIYRFRRDDDALEVRRGSTRIASGPVERAVSAFLTHVNVQAIATVENSLVLHAAAVAVSGRALVIPAQPGAGKSTLCAALVAAGADYLTDEAVPLLPDGRALPYPKPIVVGSGSFPVLEAWAGTSPALGRHPASVWWLDPADLNRARWCEPVTIGWVIAARYGPGQPLELKPMSAAATTATMASNAFNLPRFGRTGLEQLADLSRHVSGFELQHGDAARAADAVLHLVR